MARQIAEQRQARERNAQLAPAAAAGSRSRPGRGAQGGRGRRSSTSSSRATCSGSVEALEDALLKIDVGEARRSRCGSSTAASVRITENDVNLAIASDAVIIGFNVRPEGKARELAEREGVEIRYYSVIYQAIEEIEAALKGMLKPEFEEVAARHRGGPRGLPGAARSATSPAALVRSGTIRRNAKARLIRDGVVVADNLTVELAASGSRTTRPRSARASSAVSGSGRSTTSRSTTSSRRSRCGRSRGSKAGHGRLFTGSLVADLLLGDVTR